VTLNLSNNTTKDVDVTWTSATYDGTKTASYIFTGAYSLPEGVTGTMPGVTVSVVVGMNPDLTAIEAAKFAVTSLETAATKDLTVEANLTGAEALVQPAKDAVAKVNDASEKTALNAKIVVAEKIVTDARTAFNKKDFAYTVTDGKAQITYYRGAGGVVIIPSTLGGVPVTSIGDYTFYNCSALTSISIPEGITAIGNNAFYYCSSLTSIIIPQLVTSIGRYAFGNCSSLTSISIPQGVTSIGDAAFFFCSGLTSISLPEGLTSIGDSAFSDCVGLTSITIPQGVTSVSRYVFYLCYGLKSIRFNSPTTKIDDSMLTISSATKIIGFATSTAKDYATKYGRTFEVIPLAVTSVSLNKATDSLTVGGTDTLITTVAPINATNQAVTWTSSANDIATVDNTGKVTGVSAGTATITVTTSDGSKTATCAITVAVAISNTITVDTTISQDTAITGELIIAPSARLTVNSGIKLTVTGSVYVYGEFYNSGVLNISDTLYTNNYNNMFFGDPTLSTGKFIGSGSASINSLTTYIPRGYSQS